MRNLNDLIREHKNVKKALAEYLQAEPAPAQAPAPRAPVGIAGGPALMRRDQPAPEPAAPADLPTTSGKGKRG